MSAEIYWIEDVTDGRLAIVGRPRAGDWLSDEIMDWKSAGLTDVVSLLEEHEIRDLDLTREAEIAERVGLTFEKFSIPDRGVPASFESAHTLWNRLAAKISAGRSVGIHCRAGIWRSGLMQRACCSAWGSQRTTHGSVPQRRVDCRQYQILRSSANGSATRLAAGLLTNIVVLDTRQVRALLTAYQYPDATSQPLWCGLPENVWRSGGRSDVHQYAVQPAFQLPASCVARDH
jgi:hypothetical protein